MLLPKDRSIDLFRELTEGLPRQGPGSTEATLRALAMVANLPPRPRILDVGCGPGAQTVDLARATGGEIVALDRSEGLLNELVERAAAAGVSGRITTRCESMFHMNFSDEEFDLVWSEGAIYIMGFATGLDRCRRFLRPGGSMVVSELTWLVEIPPQEARDYWATNYPGMQTLEANRRIASEAGYTDVRAFTLPVADWWANYYGPAEARLRKVRARYADDRDIAKRLDEIAREYDLFREYSDAYGYVFYIMTKARDLR